MNTKTQYATALLAVFLFGVAGCGGDDAADKAEAGAALEDQLATVVSEFERAVEEARSLREDIVAVRDDMAAVREVANNQVERASSEAARLRNEIVAMRMEMQEIAAAAATEAQRSAEQAQSLKDEIAEIREQMDAVRESARKWEALTDQEIAGLLSESDVYLSPRVTVDNSSDMPGAFRRRQRVPITVIYPPANAHSPFSSVNRNYGNYGYRYNRPANARPRGSNSATNSRGSQSSQGSEGSQGSQGMGSRPSSPNGSSSRPPAPSPRPAAPAPRPAPRVAHGEPQRVRIPQPER